MNKWVLLNLRGFFNYKIYKSNTPYMKTIHTIFAHNDNQIHPLCMPINGGWAQIHIITGKIWDKIWGTTR